MVRLNADLPDWVYFKFKSMVGERKLSETMRNLVLGFIGVQDSENLEIIEKNIILLKQELETETFKQLALLEKRNKELKEIQAEADEQRKRLKDAEFNTLKEQMSRGDF